MMRLHNPVLRGFNPSIPRVGEDYYLATSTFADDGREWVVNMQWDYRPALPRFGGRELQEYSTKNACNFMPRQTARSGMSFQ